MFSSPVPIAGRLLHRIKYSYINNRKENKIINQSIDRIKTDTHEFLNERNRISNVMLPNHNHQTDANRHGDGTQIISSAFRRGRCCIVGIYLTWWRFCAG